MCNVGVSPETLSAAAYNVKNYSTHNPTDR